MRQTRSIEIGVGLFMAAGLVALARDAGLELTERGALIVLDRRDVFLSADRIDITDEAIERVNANAD